MFGYSVGGKTSFQHLKWANVMSSISQVPREEMLYKDETFERARNRAMWWLEQKHMPWMTILLRKVNRHGNMLMDFCASTCFTAEALILPDQHERFVKCSVSPELLTAAGPDFVLRFSA